MEYVYSYLKYELAQSSKSELFTYDHIAINIRLK